MDMGLEKVVANLVERVERRFYGKYRGFVVNNADPENLGRLKLQVPSVLGKDVVTGWAMPCVPYGGNENQGMLFIPEVKAGVWVEFEEGDLEFPIWVGTFWSKPKGKSEVPKTNKPDGLEDNALQKPLTCKMIKTLKGHTLQFEDKDGQERITLVDGKNEHVITLSKEGITITEAKRNQIILSQKGIEILEASDNKFTLSPEGIHLTQANNNQLVLNSEGIELLEVNGNKFTLNKDGIRLAEANGNELLMGRDQYKLLAKVPLTLEAEGQAIVIKGNTIDFQKG